jgi:hypothetical protein
MGGEWRGEQQREPSGLFNRVLLQCYCSSKEDSFFFVVVQHGGPVCFLSFVIFSKKNLICERRSGFILLMYCGISLFLYKE